MKSDLYTKVIFTIIAVCLSVIAIQISITPATAQIYARDTGMQMMRLCEKTGSSIGCVDITPDYHLKVQVKDFDNLPNRISQQLSNQLSNQLVTNIAAQMNQQNSTLYSKISGDLTLQMSMLSSQINNLQQKSPTRTPSR